MTVTQSLIIQAIWLAVTFVGLWLYRLYRRYSIRRYINRNDYDEEFVRELQLDLQERTNMVDRQYIDEAKLRKKYKKLKSKYEALKELVSQIDKK